MGVSTRHSEQYTPGIASPLSLKTELPLPTAKAPFSLGPSHLVCLDLLCIRYKEILFNNRLKKWGLWVLLKKSHKMPPLLPLVPSSATPSGSSQASERVWSCKENGTHLWKYCWGITDTDTMPAWPSGQQGRDYNERKLPAGTTATAGDKDMGANSTRYL